MYVNYAVLPPALQGSKEAVIDDAILDISTEKTVPVEKSPKKNLQITLKVRVATDEEARQLQQLPESESE